MANPHQFKAVNTGTSILFYCSACGKDKNEAMRDANGQRMVCAQLSSNTSVTALQQSQQQQQQQQINYALPPTTQSFGPPPPIFTAYPTAFPGSIGTVVPQGSSSISDASIPQPLYNFKRNLEVRNSKFNKKKNVSSNTTSSRTDSYIAHVFEDPSELKLPFDPLTLNEMRLDHQIQYGYLLIYYVTY